MKFTAVVTTHDHPTGLLNILGNLRYQTQPPDETLVFASDTPWVDRLQSDFTGVKFNVVPNRNDWGHEKRSMGLEAATGDYLGFFNDDDCYADDYVETMLGVAARTNADVVYCAWNAQPDCKFKIGQSTSGNFIVRTSLAKKVGWNGRHYEADGEFIEGLNARGARLARVNEVLYWHNRMVAP